MLSVPVGVLFSSFTIAPLALQQPFSKESRVVDLVLYSTCTSTLPRTFRMVLADGLGRP